MSRSRRSRGPGGSLDAVEEWHGEPYLVRRLRGSSSVRSYRCPGCSGEITPAVPHVVSWPAYECQATDRRHWHTPCWEARDRRDPRMTGVW